MRSTIGHAAAALCSNCPRSKIRSSCQQHDSLPKMGVLECRSNPVFHEHCSLIIPMGSIDAECFTSAQPNSELYHTIVTPEVACLHLWSTTSPQAHIPYELNGVKHNLVVTFRMLRCPRLQQESGRSCSYIMLKEISCATEHPKAMLLFMCSEASPSCTKMCS